MHAPPLRACSPTTHTSRHAVCGALAGFGARQRGARQPSAARARGKEQGGFDGPLLTAMGELRCAPAPPGSFSSCTVTLLAVVLRAPNSTETFATP